MRKTETIQKIKELLNENVTMIYTNECYRYLLNKAESTINKRYSKEELQEILSELETAIAKETPFHETKEASDIVNYKIWDKEVLKETPFMNFDEWFRAKYGKYESTIRMEMSKIVPDNFEGDLTSFYHVHVGSVSNLEEGDGYQDNDADCWGDYMRDWKEANKEETSAAGTVTTPVYEYDTKIEILEGNKDYAPGVWSIQMHTIKWRNMIGATTARKLIEQGKAILIQEAAEETAATDETPAPVTLSDMKKYEIAIGNIDRDIRFGITGNIFNRKMLQEIIERVPHYKAENDMEFEWKADLIAAAEKYLEDIAAAAPAPDQSSSLQLVEMISGETYRIMDEEWILGYTSYNQFIKKWQAYSVGKKHYREGDTAQESAESLDLAMREENELLRSIDMIDEKDLDLSDEEQEEYEEECNEDQRIPEEDQKMESLEPLHNPQCTVCHSEDRVRKFILGDDWISVEFRLCRSDREKFIRMLQEDIQTEGKEDTWEQAVQDAFRYGITGDQILKIAKGEK